jgi:NADH:ubiquinone oxidoreductase subunit B-like Fe-S oxidoreductase
MTRGAAARHSLIDESAAFSESFAVDLYIPGRPPRPEAALDGLIKLQYRVQHERQPQLWCNLHGSGRKLD